MIRVMVIAPWARRLGGAETMLATLLAGAERGRIEPRVVFLEPGPWADELAAGRQAVSTLPPSRLRAPRAYARAVAQIARLLRGFRPDVLLNWSAKCHLYGAAAATVSRRAVPVVWWQHSVPDGGWLDRIATALPAAAVGCSSHAGARAQRRLHPQRPAFVVHPGIDVGAEPPARAGGERVRWVVGLVGNLQPIKGQDALLEALALLRGRGHDVTALFVGGDMYGSGEYVERLRGLIAANGLEQHVVFTGHVADVRPHLDAMDLYVSATRGEGFGIALLEAMSIGLPVVAVADGGPAEIVVSERSGLLVGSSTPAVIANALGRLIEDPALRQRLSAGARERVVAQFSAARMCGELERQLERIAAAG